LQPKKLNMLNKISTGRIAGRSWQNGILQRLCQEMFFPKALLAARSRIARTLTITARKLNPIHKKTTAFPDQRMENPAIAGPTTRAPLKIG